jgi:hypothetical protein
LPDFGDCFTDYNFGEGFLMLKYPSCYFGDLVAWYPDFLPSDIIQVLASVWNLDSEQVQEAYELAKKRKKYL